MEGFLPGKERNLSIADNDRIGAERNGAGIDVCEETDDLQWTAFKLLLIIVRTADVIPKNKIF